MTGVPPPTHLDKVVQFVIKRVQPFKLLKLLLQLRRRTAAQLVVHGTCMRRCMRQTHEANERMKHQ